jgi:hypothetical protein
MENIVGVCPENAVQRVKKSERAREERACEKRTSKRREERAREERAREEKREGRVCTFSSADMYLK